ncbi:hypothetical protein [Labrenzia sp. OB1]|uniref:HoxN/HupN/NixA family nickel/cobalt transporter n=1 Tax=Labrenzia sp. OB1 TaxID=1561204 RepID=UPI0009EF2144|nr:hypothetical protein [Labrenzia sp. OB1]
MDFLTVLPLGFMIGMAHALEADHLAAVTALHSQASRRTAMVRRGAIWGVGHTLSIFGVCLAVFLIGLSISTRMEAALEFTVSVMIIALALHVLWRLKRDRIHVHAHSHDGTRHIHVHSHARDQGPHRLSSHDHDHRSGFGRVLAVGMVHGLAGSAGFLVLAAATADTLGHVLVYLAVFGIGSMLGMAVLSAIISLPLGLAARKGGRVPLAVNAVIACAALYVGAALAVESFGTLFGGV